MLPRATIFVMDLLARTLACTAYSLVRSPDVGPTEADAHGIV